MPRITFEEGAIEYILDPFGMEIDDEGYVAKNGDRVTDGYGTPIKAENVGGFIPLRNHGFTVNEDGITVDENGDRIAKLAGGKDAIVPYTYDGGKMGGLVRDNVVAVGEYVQKSTSEAHS